VWRGECGGDAREPASRGVLSAASGSLWDLLTKARRKESVQAPEQQDLPLTDFWIVQMLQSESDCIYEVSRTEPFRLRHVRASEAPVTPALINRTVTTILGIMEPDT
jgi:hypothetical protein